MMGGDVADMYNMEKESVLIIFVKNFIYGSVKTRLAKTAGDDKAMEIYKRLVHHTVSVAADLRYDKMVCYSEYVDVDDIFDKGFKKSVQHGDDLGERMHNAIDEAFKQGYRKVVIVGSDCIEITTAILNEAFAALSLTDLVIGPANDGGYYLLGMTTIHPALFTAKNWSTDNVYKQTMNDVTAIGLSCSFLPILTDIDEEKDLTALKHLL